MKKAAGNGGLPNTNSFTALKVIFHIRLVLNFFLYLKFMHKHAGKHSEFKMKRVRDVWTQIYFRCDNGPQKPQKFMWEGACINTPHIRVHSSRQRQSFQKQVSDPANVIHFSFLFIFLTAASEVTKDVLKNDCDGDRRWCERRRGVTMIRDEHRNFKHPLSTTTFIIFVLIILGSVPWIHIRDSYQPDYTGSNGRYSDVQKRDRHKMWI
jgi:hypothetical protein